MNNRCPDLELEALSDRELKKRLDFEDWKDVVRHVPDEVVFRLFRRAQQAGNTQRIGLLSEALSRRILARARDFAAKSGIYPGVIGDLDDASQEIGQALWERLTNSESDVRHAERAFGQLFKRRAIDFQRKLLAKKRSKQSSLDALNQIDEGDHSEKATQVVPALHNEECPDEILARKQEFEKLRSAMHAVLTSEEFSVLEMLFDLEMPVKDVAKALSVTERSVRNYKNRAFAKLKKELTQ